MTNTLERSMPYDTAGTSHVAGLAQAGTWSGADISDQNTRGHDYDSHEMNTWTTRPPTTTSGFSRHVIFHTPSVCPTTMHGNDSRVEAVFHSRKYMASLAMSCMERWRGRTPMANRRGRHPLIGRSAECPRQTPGRQNRPQTRTPHRTVSTPPGSRIKSGQQDSQVFQYPTPQHETSKHIKKESHMSRYKRIREQTPKSPYEK